MMTQNWASDTHWRLYLQGHNGRERQRIIDIAAVRMWDPIALGNAIARQNKMAIDNLQIVIPRRTWHVEVLCWVCYWWRSAVETCARWEFGD